MVFTTRLSGGRGGRNGLEHELRRLGVRQKNGSPNHPQTQGKVERFQQTLKNWLARQPPAATLAALQAQLDAFAALYNTRRPHRSLNRATPATAYAARPKAVPGTPAAAPEQRVRTGRADTDGKISLDLNGKRHSIGTGREHARTRVLILVNGPRMRIINRDTGELIRELTIDPARNYQPTGKPRGRRKTPPPK